MNIKKCESTELFKSLFAPNNEEENTHLLCLIYIGEQVLMVDQGDRSCAKARRAFAEKFGFGRKFWALTYAILSQY